jgi:two-component system, NtrC family, response regulator AtoC
MPTMTDGNILPVDKVSAWSPTFVNGVSPSMRALDRVVADIAPTDIPVLLIGESGTGKEAVALEIHRHSQRSSGPFVKWSCSTLAWGSPLMDLPWGGKGTGGKGAANVGTLFLDEISQLEPSNQSRILTLLPDGDRVPSGRYLGARIISATTRNLEEEMWGGRFQQELYYRINGVCLRLPSLRNRKEDIPVLLDFFLRKYASLFNRQAPRLGSMTMDLLLQHAWPGNVRELENAVRKIVALGDEQLALSDLTVGARVVMPEPALPSATGSSKSNGKSLKEAAREASRKAERELILKALDRTHWNRKRTARELQISYKALLYKLKQLNLDGIDSGS